MVCRARPALLPLLCLTGALLLGPGPLARAGQEPELRACFTAAARSLGLGSRFAPLDLEADPIVRIRRFPFRKGFLTLGRKYLAETRSGRPLILKEAAELRAGKGDGAPINPALPRYEAAAYVLSEILGFGLVPPTVVTSIQIEGRTVLVSAQHWVGDGRHFSSLLQDLVGLMMHHRSANPLYREAWSSQDPRRQLELGRLLVFDYLADVQDRKGQNVLVDGEGSLVAIDNGFAFFGKYVGMMGPSMIAIRMTPELQAGLRKLDASTLAPLREYLTEEEIGQILKRRDALLSLPVERGPAD